MKTKTTAGIIGAAVFAATLTADPFDHWTQVAKEADVGKVYSLEHNGKHFIAHGSEGIFKSDDGLKWEQVEPRADNQISGAIFWEQGNSWIVTLRDRIFFSENGEDWFFRQWLGSPLRDVTASADGTLVAAATASIHRSLDGVNWRKVADIKGGYKAHWLEGTFYVTGGGDGTGLIAESSDGETWEMFQSPATRVHGVTQAGGAVVASGKDGVLLMRGSDKWEAANLPNLPTEADRFHYAAGNIFAATGLAPHTSTDALNWIGREPPTESVTACRDVADDGIRVYFCNENGIFRSDAFADPADTPTSLQLNLYPGALVSGVAGMRYRIESAPNADGPWTEEETLLLPEAEHLWIDRNGIGQPRRFYRSSLVD